MALASSSDPRAGTREGRLRGLSPQATKLRSAEDTPTEAAALSDDGVVGAMNVYAHAKHAFDGRAAELGELFASPAAIAVQNAQLLAQAERLIGRLRSALATRAVVERATGILMSRSGLGEQAALARLQGLSQHEHRKLAEVAEQIVNEALGRARGRHQNG